MLKLELDWVAEGDAPDTGVVSDVGDEVLIVVAYDATPNASNGHGTVSVYAHALSGEAYSELMAMFAWLIDTQYALDSDEANDLLDTANVV